MEPLFKIDPETGKRVPLPLPRGLMSPNSVRKESDKKSKRVLNIAPLNLTAADFEEPPNRASKLRKVDHSVRKELFNLPARGSYMPRPSMNVRNALSRRSIASKKVQPKKYKPSESPLLDMEEMEEELIKKRGFLQGYPFKTPSKPAIKFSKDSKYTPFRERNKFDKKNIPKIEISQGTPKSSSSNESEFLELEKMCGVEEMDKKERDMSPISSVCNLLEGTNINSNKKDKNILSSDTYIEQSINDIKKSLAENRTAFEEYKVSHDTKISQIMDILETDRKEYQNLVLIQDKNDTAIKDIVDQINHALSSTAAQKEANKENTPIRNRRSIRLRNKSPAQAKNAKLVVSPVVLRGGDLRKSTLTKNLVTKTQQYNIESPRIRKALDMYNSMRSEMSVLATPQMNRQYLIESPRGTNLSRNLSRRVQNQCLLLQDTPTHN